jgi:hypothetical protein
MWMTSYISEIKRQFRDKYKFVPSGGTEQEPLFDSIPDGTYPMEIDGKMDYVVIKGDSISCCNPHPGIHGNPQ